MSAGIAHRCWAASPAPRTLKARPSIKVNGCDHWRESHVFL